MQNKDMQTKDPALTKTPIDDQVDHHEIHNDRTHDGIAEAILAPDATTLGHDNEDKSTQTFQETVIGTRYASDDVEHGDHMHEDIHHDSYNVMSTDDSIVDNTNINKGTETFETGVFDSKHVNDNDNPARQPDRRDQEGNAFDEGVNEHTTVDDASKSTEINDRNRYASVDNAQTRVLNPDDKD